MVCVEINIQCFLKGAQHSRLLPGHLDARLAVWDWSPMTRLSSYVLVSSPGKPVLQPPSAEEGAMPPLTGHPPRDKRSSKFFVRKKEHSEFTETRGHGSSEVFV